MKAAEDFRNIVTIEGVDYPLCQNVDALCMYEDISGKDYASIRMTSIRDTSLLFWCFAVAGSRRIGKEFPLTLEEFRATADTATLAKWFAANTQKEEATHPEGQKKSPSRSGKR